MLAVAIVAGAVALDLSSVAAQSDEQTGRIVAQRLADGRTEFGWQPAGGERVLPRARYFPAEVGHQRWLNSSPVEVGGAEIGRINARRLSDGRIEFAFTPTDGERILPSSRYFPVDARVGRWLRSTEITISAAPAAGFVAISAGPEYTCAIRAGSGAIECWGRNTRPIRNEETEEWEEIYVGRADAPAGSFTAVSVGYEHACGLRESGAIECWGRNQYGQSTPPAGRFTAVSAGSGSNYTCGLRENGAIQCWGNDTDGRTDAPAGWFGAVSAGGAHTCGLRENGAIECWGGNSEGQADAPAGSFIAIAAGSVHTCALHTNGAIQCWGRNSLGQADAPAGWFGAVSAGGDHTCGLRENGAIECWGWNNAGQTDAPAP